MQARRERLLSEGSHAPRREIGQLRSRIKTEIGRIDALNHERYRMQAIVEAVKPDYERAQRLRGAIADMKRVWLGAGSTEAERERVLRENLRVLTPEYRSIRLSKPAGARTRARPGSMAPPSCPAAPRATSRSIC